MSFSFWWAESASLLIGVRYCHHRNTPSKSSVDHRWNASLHVIFKFLEIDSTHGSKYFWSFPFWSQCFPPQGYSFLKCTGGVIPHLLFPWNYGEI